MLRFTDKYQEEMPADGDNSGEPATPAPSNEELMAKLAQYEQDNTSMQGKMAELLTEKKAEQSKRKEADDLRKAADLDSQRKAGDLEAFEKTITEQFGVKETKYSDEISRLNGMILGGRKNEIIADLSNDFISPAAAKLMLGSLISAEHGDNNTISTSFKGLDGQLVTTDPKAFKEYLQNNEVFASLLKGVDSSGGLSTASKPAASGGKSITTDKQSRIDAINKRFNS